jgi:hypothetical protein
MEHHLLTCVVMILLSSTFGCYGALSLFKAYRTTDSGVWIEQAVQGAVGMIASGFLADIALRV